MAEILQHQYENGLRLIGEQIAETESVSMSLLLPAGAAAEPADQQGVAAMLAEMIFRGAGELDAKAHSDALDQLGAQRDSDVESIHMRLGASMLTSKLSQALPLLTDMVRRPLLAATALEPSRDLALQALAAVEDEPQQKVFIQLKQRHMPEPFGRSALGVRAHLESLDLDQVRSYWQAAFVPDGAVLSFAGQFDFSQLVDQVGQALGQWQGQTREPTQTQTPQRGCAHEQAETAQVHIGLMYDALPESDERSILWRAAMAVLSGGMSSRLFTEVREKRGLCYAVYAAYAGHRDRGVVLSYAGTTPPRAQETLDVLCGEHQRLGEGIDDSEFERAIVGMKSRLVMQGESTSARARALATDQYIYGQLRSLDEWAEIVDAVTLDALQQFVAENPPGSMTMVTIGPEALEAKAETLGSSN